MEYNECSDLLLRITIIIIISLLAGVLSILGGAEVHVSVQNTINAASDGNDTRGETATSIAQTGPGLEEKKGVIVSAPKCLGSALCPD